MNQSEAETNRKRGKSLRRTTIRCTQDDCQKHESHHDLGNQSCGQAVSARRVFSVTVGGESRARIEARLTTGDQVQYRGSRQSTGYLRQYVGEKLAFVESTPCPKSEGHRGIEVTTRDVTDGIGHRQHGKSKRQRYAQQADTHIGKTDGEHGAAATSQHQPESADKFSPQFFCHGHLPLPS